MPIFRTIAKVVYSWLFRSRKQRFFLMTQPISSSTTRDDAWIAQALKTAGMHSTQTKAGWCLRQGLQHLANQGLGDVIRQHGVPTLYHAPASSATACRHDDEVTPPRAPRTALESLCRIVVGQFVSGYAAQAAWQRVLALRNDSDGDNDTLLQPHHILAVVNNQDWHISLGITRHKAKALADLARRFDDGRLSEEILQTEMDVDKLRKMLLAVHGVGPWSCDMFLLFFLHHSDVLPLGDLGVRKGLARYFFDDRTLCPKKDAAHIHETLRPWQPYRSLVSWYMYKVADAPVPTPSGEAEPNHVARTPTKSRRKREKASTPLPRKKARHRVVSP